MSDSPIIAGIDEAGRGPLAGPVVAAACVIPCELFRRRGGPIRWSPHKRAPATDCLIADSKALTDDEREAAYAWIIAHCSHGVAMTEAHDIDAIGILEATNRAMQEAVSLLARSVTPTYLLVDGCDAFWFDYPHSSVIRGDQSEPCIAAASILAKVTRDRLMRTHADTYPLFNFAQHKGYGTDEHRAAIKAHGPCVLHRKTFLESMSS